MVSFEVNFVTIIIAALASTIVGFIWYGPLFGKQWAALSGVSMDKKPAPSVLARKTGMNVIAQIITAFVLINILTYAGSTTLSTAALTAFWVWLGFFATTLFGSVIWEEKPFNLWVLNGAHWLVSLVIMSAVAVSI